MLDTEKSTVAHQGRTIPDFFKPEKYTASTPDEWLEEIYYRTKLYEEYQQGQLSSEELKDKFLAILVEKERTPITSYFGIPMFYPVKDTSMYDVLKIAYLIQESEFYENSIYDIKSLIKTGEWGEGDKNTWDKDLTQSLADFKLMPWFGFYADGERQQPHPAFTDGCPVTIDLNFGDEEIVAGLKNWLRKMRGEGAKPTSESRYFMERFNEWKKFQILPAFDIFLWGKLNAISYTHQQVGDFLWKHESLSAIELKDRVRKVITNGRNAREQGKIDKIFNKITLTRLWRFCELLHQK